jgi:hypothetical protein
MNDLTAWQNYANDLIFELQKSFWDERGKGARYRMTTVGRTFFETACLPRLQSTEIDDMIRTVESVLQEKGIVGSLDASRDGRLLRLRVAGCIHRPVEDSLAAADTKPLACVPANLIVLAIEEKLDRPAELAEISLEDGACQMLIVLFDRRPVLA